MSPVNARTGEIEHYLFRSRALAATTNGPALDIRDYDGRLAFTAVSQGCSGGTTTCAVKLQHSTDNSTWTDVASGTITTFGTTSKGACVGFSCQQLRRYIRAVATLGAGTAITLTVAVRGYKQTTCL